MSSLTSARKIGTTLSKHWDISLGVVFTVTSNFLYKMDFGGHWAERAKETKLFIDECKASVDNIKHYRESYEDMLVKAREKEARQMAENKKVESEVDCSSR